MIRGCYSGYYQLFLDYCEFRYLIAMVAGVAAVIAAVILAVVAAAVAEVDLIVINFLEQFNSQQEFKDSVIIVAFFFHLELRRIRFYLFQIKQMQWC